MNHKNRYNMSYKKEIDRPAGLIHWKFMNEQIGNDDAKFIANALKGTQVLILNLSYNWIGSEGAKYLAEALKSTQITTLDLSGNTIGDEGVKHLAQGLKESKIKRLYLRCNEISDNGIKFLAQVLESTKIISLDLRDNLIGVDGAKYIIEILDKTKISSLSMQIHLTENYGTQHIMYRTFCDAKKNVISLETNRIGPNGAKFINETFQGIHIFQLKIAPKIGWNRSSTEDIKYLVEVLRYSSISRLILSEDNIGTETAMYLAEGLKNSQIAHIKLADNPLGSRGIKYFAEILKYSQITHLNLCNVRMGNDGMEYLVQGLKDSQVQNLDLSNNGIIDDVVRNLAQVLEFTQITELNLKNNCMSVHGAHYINEVLNRTRKFHLLMDIKLAERSDYSQCISYKSYNDVKRIEISINKIRDNQARCMDENFQNFPILVLRLHYTTLEANHVQYLSEAFRNGIMTLSSISTMKDDDIKNLIQAFKSTKFTRLHLENGRLESTGIKNLADFLKEVEIIDLNLSSNDIDDDGVAYLAQSLKDSIILNLNLSGNHISDGGLKYLVEVLRYTHITKLDLSNNKITNKGVKYLADGLMQSQVRSINLHGNMVENKGCQYLKNIINNTFGTLADEITLSFESILTFNSLSSRFEFTMNRNYSSPKNIDHYVFLIKKLNDNPFLKAHIFDKYCRVEKDYFDIVLMNKINDSINSFPESFNTLFNKELLFFIELTPKYDYVNLVRQLDDSKLYDIVKNLLLHRELYYVDEKREILHPFIYQMLHKHEMTLYDEELEPEKKEKIISYYQNHLKIDGAKEIINLLVSSENKTKKNRTKRTVLNIIWNFFSGRFCRSMPVKTSFRR